MAIELLWNNTWHKYSLTFHLLGPTIGGGKSLVVPLLLNKSEIGKGNKILFETAVEDKGYFRGDLSFELTEKSLNDSFEGTGFIKTVRTLSN